MKTRKATELTRRDFLTASAATAALVASGNYAFAAGDDTMRVGLIGCGGRGSGAIVNAVESSPGVELIAIGDLFQDHIDGKKEGLKNEFASKGRADAYKLKDDHCFTGFDAYKKVLATDCN